MAREIGGRWPQFFSQPYNEPLLYSTAASPSFTVVRPYRRRPRCLKDVSSSYLCSRRNCGVLSRLKLLRRQFRTLRLRHHLLQRPSTLDTSLNSRGARYSTPLTPSFCRVFPPTPLSLHGVIVLRPFPPHSLAGSTCSVTSAPVVTTSPQQRSLATDLSSPLRSRVPRCDWL